MNDAKTYPCPAAFSQLYMVPRHHLDLRFCSYHKPITLKNQDRFFQKGYKSLEDFFSQNKELLRIREAYLKGDYISGAGCSRDCYWYCNWKMSGKGYPLDTFQNADGSFSIKRLWLSLGPDCNLRCRYCLDPENFHIDYNTCDTRAISLAKEFVASGGKVLLTGGEPFLPKFKLAEALSELAERRDSVKGYFEIHTNGTYLNERMRNLILRSPIKSINISMDTQRKETFEFLRRGASFQAVWGNVRALKKEKDTLGLNKPEIIILCAVLKDTYDHLRETVDKFVSEGISISLNALFKSYYSPDFCQDHGLQNIELKELRKLARDIEKIEHQYGPNGPVAYQGLKGQVMNLIDLKQSGNFESQVVLGHGGEAIRKASFLTLIRKGRGRAAVRDGLRKLYRFLKGL